LIHKLRESEIDGFTIVYGEGMEKWTPLSEVSELKEAAQRVAEEELKTQLVMSAVPTEESHVFVDDEIKTLIEPFPSALPASHEKKRFVADNGVRYMWDEMAQDWVEDDSLSQSESEEENEEKNEGDEEGKSESTEKRKRKKKKKDTSGWKDSVGSKFWIYIENLPLDITLDEMKAHFSKVTPHLSAFAPPLGSLSQVGLIALSPVDQLPKIKIYRDESGQPKGDASICYNAAESVEMAVDIFDGGYIRPNTRPISVSRAEFQKKDSASSSSSVSVAPGDDQQKRKRGKVTHAQVKVTQNALAQALAWNEDDDLGPSTHSPASFPV
jgi:HIV Tat-specific factor 1